MARPGLIIKILFLFLIAASTVVGQTDSTKIRVSVSLQVKDWLFLDAYLTDVNVFENVYDSVKARIRTTIAPTLTTIVKVDSIKQGQVIKLAQILKMSSYGTVVIPYSRINAALRLNPYLVTRIDAMDTDYLNNYLLRLSQELDKLRAVLTDQP